MLHCTWISCKPTIYYHGNFTRIHGVMVNNVPVWPAMSYHLPIMSLFRPCNMKTCVTAHVFGEVRTWSFFSTDHCGPIMTVQWIIGKLLNMASSTFHCYSLSFLPPIDSAVAPQLDCISSFQISDCALWKRTNQSWDRKTRCCLFMIKIKSFFLVFQFRKQIAIPEWPVQLFFC